MLRDYKGSFSYDDKENIKESKIQNIYSELLFEKKPILSQPTKPDESRLVRKIGADLADLDEYEYFTKPPLNRIYSEDKIGDQRLYSVTLDSKSNFGTYSSNGKALMVKLDSYRYDLKAVLYPQNPGVLGISKPYYIHAIITQSPGAMGKVHLNCSGYAYITKLFSSTLPANNIKVELSKPATSHVNEYQFTLNPITLFGMSPGKTQNSGKLVLLSKTVDKESAEELAFCNKIALDHTKLK